MFANQVLLKDHLENPKAGFSQIPQVLPYLSLIKPYYPHLFPQEFFSLQDSVLTPIRRISWFTSTLVHPSKIPERYDCQSRAFTATVRGLKKSATSMFLQPLNST